MPSLGRLATTTIAGIPSDAIRNCTVTDECESIDITCRQNAQDGFRAFETSFVSTTYEIETLNLGSCAVGEVNATTTVTNIQENQPLDDVVSYTVTVKVSG
jgi:hypothetical protein